MLNKRILSIALTLILSLGNITGYASEENTNADIDTEQLLSEYTIDETNELPEDTHLVEELLKKSIRKSKQVKYWAKA